MVLSAGATAGALAVAAPSACSVALTVVCALVSNLMTDRCFEPAFLGEATILDMEPGAFPSFDDRERMLGRRFHDRNTLLQVEPLRFLLAAASLGAIGATGGAPHRAQRLVGSSADSTGSRIP